MTKTQSALSVTSNTNIKKSNQDKNNKLDNINVEKQLNNGKIKGSAKSKTKKNILTTEIIDSQKYLFQFETFSIDQFIFEFQQITGEKFADFVRCMFLKLTFTSHYV